MSSWEHVYTVLKPRENGLGTLVFWSRAININPHGFLSFSSSSFYFSLFFLKPFIYEDFLDNIPNKQIFCLCLHISGDRELIARPVGLLSDSSGR